MCRYSLLSGISVAACAIAVSTAACAQSERAFDIPPGDLAGALRAFATQSDQQIFFAADMVAGLRSPGVRGRLSSPMALDRILAGSGLGWSQSRPGVFTLQPRRADAEPTPVELDDVVVTGSLLRATGELASPVLMLDRDALDRRGFGTVAETLTALPQNYAGSGTPNARLAGTDRGGSNAVGSTGVNLRGLGPDATLTLVNGRRLAGTGFRGEFADVSALPSAAVERVDVLLDGASALYGADAVAGVVNVIMRRTFEGQESRVRVSAAEGGAEDVIASHLAGRSWASGAALLAYEYQTANPLSSRDRAFTRDGDLRPFGGSDRRTVFSSPGNIVAYDSARGSYVSRWAIRPGATGAATSPSDFAAGQANLQAPSLGIDLVPEIERHSVYGRVRQSLGDRLDLSGDVRFSRRAYGFTNVPIGAVFNVTRANPFFVSPNGAASHLIAYSFSGDLGSSRQSGTSTSLGVTAGGAYALDGDWSLDGYLAYATERGESRLSGQVNTLFLDEALGNRADNPATAHVAARDGFFNPFGNGQANSAAVLEFIGAGYSGSLNRSRATSANLLLEGPLLTLPGGDLQVALGVQVREETFDTRSVAFLSSAAPVETVTPGRERSIAAVFAEGRIPLFGPDNARPGLRRLELSLAGRVEAYDDFGTTTNPRVGAVWSPLEDLTLRASWGTSFRAPALPQLFDTSVTGATLLARGDGSRVLALYLYGGNPDLEPETAETWTLGFDYQRPQGVRISLSYFDTGFSDRISQPVTENISGALTDPSLAPFVRRVDAANNPADLALVQGYISDPAFSFGTLFPPSAYGAILDGRWVNTALVDVRGLDGSASYPLTLGDQKVVLEASASYLFAFDVQGTPAAAVRRQVGRVGYPTRLRSRAGATWTRGDVDVALHWNHVADYRDAAGRGIDAWNTADLRISWAPVAGVFEGLRLALSVKNLFDLDPPFYDSPTGFGFDGGQADLLGRVTSLQLIRRW